MKGSRVILNGNLIHRGDLWRRGRVTSERIGLIVIQSKMTLRDIAWYYSQKWPHITPGPNYMRPFDQSHFTKVIKGTRNTPRYVKAIEESWGLSIEEIRRIYREDKERERLGEPYSREEINTFANWYIQILKTKRAAS
ncbi:hypothetical protein CFV95_006135 [Leptospira interrogans]|uniref:Uncharacterized protein n=1 Tax=Leptospira interrogans TaxID=173 RepID=A0AAV9FQW9_LEPIR|nr:hypothetical protein [Leptospira interrogans]KAK2618623.1 hypothetical protein CFV95_006135 [Leptospira interrogans]